MKKQFILCVKNKGYEASLEVLKIYEIIPDSEARTYGRVRIIDESGEDYLFPGDYFAPVRLLKETRKKILENV